jgi:glycosyltransferase involved in cell wall biosynthesis
MPAKPQNSHERIKVLHIVEDLSLGGQEKVIFNLCRHMDRGRFDQRVWALTKGGLMADILQRQGLPPRLLGMGPRPSLSFMYRMVRQLRAENPDIVHTHGTTANTIARLAAVLARVPHIIAHYHSFPDPFTRRQRWCTRLAAPFTDAVVCISNAVRSGILSFEPTARSKMKVIYNGSPSLARAPQPGLKAKLGIPDRDAVILCAASLTKHKGHRYLMEAFSLMLQLVPRATLVLAGAGPLRRRLEEQAAALDVAHKVVFTGVYPAIEELISICDVAVLTTDALEGLSLWLVEAMSAGRPLVGTAVGGVPEVIAHGTNGLLVPPHDIPNLAQALVSLLSDPALAKAMGSAGVGIYRTKFTMERMIGEVSALYERLCQG